MGSETGQGGAGAGAGQGGAGAGQGAAGAGQGGAGAGQGGAGAPVDVLKLEGEQFHAVLPEEIRSKPYVKELKNFSDFVKKFDGAQTLLGQRAVPADDASAEEWNAFFARAGRPEKPDGYKLPTEIEGVPKEYVQQFLDKGIMAQMLHTAGLNSRQATVAATQLISMVYKAEQASKTAADASFEQVMEKTFGKEKATIIENGKKMLGAYVPDAVKPLVAGLDDNAWAVLIAATEGIVKKHIREDGFRGGGTGGTGGGAPDNVQSIQAKMAAIHAQPEYGQPHLNRAKNAELVAQMNSLREKLKQLQGG